MEGKIKGRCRSKVAHSFWYFFFQIIGLVVDEFRYAIDLAK
jgi:hypothetical protein